MSALDARVAAPITLAVALLARGLFALGGWLWRAGDEALVTEFGDEGDETR